MSKKQSKLTSFWPDDDDDLQILSAYCPGSSHDGKRLLDTSSLKISAAKRPMQWVASSFGGFDDFPGTQISSQAKSSNQATHSKKTASTSFSVPSITKPASSISKHIQKSASLPSTINASRKRPREPIHRVPTGRALQKRSALSSGDLWSDRNAPQNRADLAVHPKKIVEVEVWLRNYQRNIGKTCPVLLLTGPAGCGKTATIKVLCQELGLEIQEWINPITATYGESRDKDDWKLPGYSRGDFPETDSQVKVFQDFLLRANKYQSLGIFGAESTQGKMILVEDFPNIFFRDPSSFHDVLRRYCRQGRCPLVFIISDSASGESNERLLFPPAIQTELAMSNISFNPVAMTLLTKMLSRVTSTEASQVSNKFSVPSKAVIESIAMSSAGDIRGAVNALQFASLKDTGDLVKGKKRNTKASSAKRGGSSLSGKYRFSNSDKSDGSTKDGDMNAIGSRDTSMYLFRALGKILYCKREECDEQTGGSKLPAHLADHHREPLLFNPEDVIEKCHISGDFFNAYLHQNHLDFFSEISDIERCSEYFSDADFLSSVWTSKSTLADYSASVAARGLIHSNRTGFKSGSGQGWKPLHKPQWYATVRKARSSIEAGKAFFKGHWWTPEVLFTELVPYISVINITLHNPRQISFLQEICKFSDTKTSLRSNPEKLDDKEVAGLAMDEDSRSLSTSLSTVTVTNENREESTEDDVIITNSQANVTVPQDDEDDEVVIEDFDDFLD